MTTHFRACNLCEAICGLEIETDDRRVVSIRGDAKDVLSHGHLCPKGVALQDIYNDPDRLRQPMRKDANGEWRQVSWSAAFDEIAARTIAIRKQHGSESVAMYLGNPTVHNYGSLLFSRSLASAIGRPQMYSATSVDQLPHHFASSYMFGHSMLIPIPDVDRTDFMLIMGANPIASNGSIMTAPGISNRLKAIGKRGGKIVLIDPRTTETARVADEHHCIRPGQDVWLLAALLHVIIAEGLDDNGRLSGLSNDRETVKRLVADVTPEVAANRTGISADTIQQLARQFAGSKTAVCYGRMGLSTQSHGGLCQWLVNVLNIVTGNFDRAGGAMFTTPAVNVVGRSSTFSNVGRRSTRIRSLPEFDGQFPVAALAEEILEPGDKQLRALFTVCGNPVLSTPNGRQLDQAFDRLDLMVSVDIYLNETTRHADFILPPPSGLEVDHYDLAFHALAVRNTAKFSQVTLPPAEDSRADWQILSELAKRISPSQGGLSGFKQRLVQRIMQKLGPTGILDLGLKFGPYGAWSSPLRWKNGLTLARLRKQPHGVDLGPLQPKLPKCLRTADDRISLAPDVFVSRFQDIKKEAAQQDAACSQRDSDVFELIGRRHVRSCNSWMHNSKRLTKGKTLCTLMMNSEDAERLKLPDGESVSVTSSVGTVELPLEHTDSMMPGVVSIPHGYGHNRQGIQIEVAERNGGASINDLTDDKAIDKLTGNAAFSGQQVTVCKKNGHNKES
ncbi:MAG: molybdopterin-dependent oxidoreductase [Fuerstiella sp.]